MLVLGSWVFPRVHTSRISAWLCGCHVPVQQTQEVLSFLYGLLSLYLLGAGDKLARDRNWGSLSVRALQCRRQCPQQKYVHLQWRLVTLVRLPPDGGCIVSGARTKDVLVPEHSPSPTHTYRAPSPGFSGFPDHRANALTGPPQKPVPVTGHLLRNSLGTSRGTEEDLARSLPVGPAGSVPLGSADNLSVDLLATWKREMTSLVEAASTDDHGIAAPLP